MSWNTSADESALDEIVQIQLRESDIVTFHNYSWPESFQAEIAWLRRFHRPVVCTEYMARSVKARATGSCPSPSRSGSESSTGDSSPVKRKRFILGSPGNAPIFSTSRRYGFTRRRALTELPTGKQKWISSDNLRENNSNLP
jgi:hypothetical protein